jgi:hypothetical protein
MSSDTVAKFNARRRQRELLTCVHFNGTVNEACKAGFAYATVRDEERRLPCYPERGEGLFPDPTPSACTIACPSHRLPTPEEVEAEERRRADAILAYLATMNSGTCPTCGLDSEPKQQVGRCVYGACGCRLYQGRLNGGGK